MGEIIPVAPEPTNKPQPLVQSRFDKRYVIGLLLLTVDNVGKVTLDSVTPDGQYVTPDPFVIV